MLDDMRCFTRVECTVQIFAPFFSVFKKFSRVFSYANLEKMGSLEALSGE